MDIRAIELTEAVTGETILSPSHYGHPESAVLDVVTDHEFVADPNSDECLYSPDGTWATTCHRLSEEHDPQPEACSECGGSGRSQFSTRGHVMPVNCPHCDGSGVVERA